MKKEFRLANFNSNIAINNKKKIGDNISLDLFNYEKNNERVIIEDYLLFNYILYILLIISFCKQFL